jgi:hypothetical protein
MKQRRQVKGGNAFLRMFGMSKPDDANSVPPAPITDVEVKPTPAPTPITDVEVKPTPAPITDAEVKSTPTKTGLFGLWGGKTKKSKRRSRSKSKSKSKKRR